MACLPVRPVVAVGLNPSPLSALVSLVVQQDNAFIFSGIAHDVVVSKPFCDVETAT